MPRKRVKQVKEPAKPVPDNTQKESDERWPESVIDKHRQRQEAAQQLAALRIEQKRLRLTNNGVPAEKRPI